MMIQRSWTKTNVVVNTDTTMSVWDSGSMRYERIIQLDKCWKVVKRSLTENGFIEILYELPDYCTPNSFTWKEDSPVNITNSGFEITGWSIETKTLGDSGQ